MTGATDPAACPRKNKRRTCSCFPCKVCGFGEHAAVHGPHYGQPPGSEPWGHEHVPQKVGRDLAIIADHYGTEPARVAVFSVPLHTCTRCGSELNLGGLDWPEPEDYAEGDLFTVWVDCHVEAIGGGDPLGEFEDGDACEETNLIYRVVQSDGEWGPVLQDRETST